MVLTSTTILDVVNQIQSITFHAHAIYESGEIELIYQIRS